MIDRRSEVHKVTSISARVSRVVEFPIPILQAKFYYIPPLEGRFQTFWGIDCRGYPVWFSIIGELIYVFFFQRDDITICFTLLGSDVLNWVCLFVCLFLETFGNFWKKAGDLNFELKLNLNLGWIWIKLEGFRRIFFLKCV